jgi:hypothetical protein
MICEGPEKAAIGLNLSIQRKGGMTPHQLLDVESDEDAVVESLTRLPHLRLNICPQSALSTSHLDSRRYTSPCSDRCSNTAIAQQAWP